MVIRSFSFFDIVLLVKRSSSRVIGVTSRAYASCAHSATHNYKTRQMLSLEKRLLYIL